MSIELHVAGRATGKATTLGGDRELVFSSATHLAARIRTRRVSAVEVLETYLAQIERHNPTLNAIVTLDLEGARRRAAEADRAMMQGEVWGPLHGVPITIKDTLETAGLRTTAGYPPLADHVPTADATVVARLRQAGAILLGKTNVPPLALNFQTENPIFGRTLNPWNTDHTPGGSSGGGAAALAAGMTALDVGSDLRGSLRVPAHYSGVYTLKPTEHRIPTTGHIPELPGTPRGVRHMDTVGPLARTVDDLALALRVMAGPDEGQWEIPPLPAQVPPRLKPARLRLAWTDDFAGVPVAGEIRAALAGLVQKLEGLGAQVERRLPHGFDFMAAWETWGELFQAEFGSTMSPQEEAEDAESGGVRPDAPSPEERGMARALNATMRQFTATLNRRDDLIGAWETFFQSWDALICPVASTPAIPHWPMDMPIPVDGQEVNYRVAGLAYCSPFNLTGHPAVVVPVTRSSAGLPIGVQLVGPRWGEARLLGIAAVLAEVAGPIGRAPGY